MSINFSGLSSGIDSSSIISKLVELERQPALLLGRRKDDLNSQLSILGDLVSKLQALGTAANKLDTAREVRSFSATSSDESRVTVGSADAVSPGTYSLRVDQLAAAETTQSDTFNTADAGVIGTGSVDITVGGNPTVNVAYDSDDSLHAIAQRITDEVDGVNASVLFDGTDYRIMVNGEDTGADNAITFKDYGDKLGLDDNGNELVAAADAEFSVDGVDITRSSNTFSDVIEGVTLELEATHDAGDADTVITVNYDVEGVREGVQEFVDAYNAVASMLDQQLSHSGEQRGRDTLFGDSTLRGLRSAMSSIVTSGYSHDGGETSMGLLGIELSESGSLSIDASKFDDAVSADPDAIESLFAGDGADGISALMDDMADSYTRAGDGILTAKKDGINNRIDSFNDQIERIENRAVGLGDRLLRQFTSLEQVMAEFQSQAGLYAGLIV